MENQEMGMEKSWKNILSSLWEPCNKLVDSHGWTFALLGKPRHAMSAYNRLVE